MSKIVRKRPWAAVCLAALIGLIVSMSVREALAMRTRTDLNIMNYQTPILGQTQVTTPFYGPPQVGTPGGVKAGYQGADYQAICMVVHIIAAPSVTTTPTLTISIEQSIDAITWVQHTAFTPFTVVADDVKNISNFARYWRIKAVMANCNYAGQGWSFQVSAYSKEWTKDSAPRPEDQIFCMRFDAASESFVSEPMSVPLPRHVRVTQRIGVPDERCRNSGGEVAYLRR